jgi:phage shock protein A
MLEKTSLAETEFNALYNNATRRLQDEIAVLKLKISELEKQINWLEQENSKHL